MKTLNIFVENIYEEFEIDEVRVHSGMQKIVEYILAQEEIVQASCLADYDFETLCFDIVLCDNEKIQEVNRDYREKDSVTDVISFAMFADSEESERFILDGEISLGEIIISLDKVKSQAQEHDHSFDSELFFLLAHGALHLLGFDHQNEDDYNFMMETQEKAKAVIGV